MEDLFGLVGGCIEGKYDVESAVAEGGFGVVYRGRHRTLLKAVAIKVLKTPENFDERARRLFLESFAREAQTIAQLDHPAIVRVLDFGTSTTPSGVEAPWMVLDWMGGETLAEKLIARRGSGGRSPAEALALLRPVLEAVACAHDHGIAHRDIKPANMMFTAETIRSTTGNSRGAPGIRLLDFGIAKVMAPDEATGSGQTRTRAGLLTFSLPYAAPEQVSGTRTGPWTDVHALALVLTELLTDCAPYPGNDAMEVHMQILAVQRPTPAKFGVDVGAWEAVLARALTPAPRERFATAGELLAALEANVPAIPSRTALAPEMDRTAPLTPSGPGVTEHSTLRPAVTSPTPSPAPRSVKPLVLAALLGVAVAVPLAVVASRRGAPPTAAPPTPAPVATAPPTSAPVVRAVTPPTPAPVALVPVTPAPRPALAVATTPPDAGALAARRVHAASHEPLRNAAPAQGAPSMPVEPYVPSVIVPAPTQHLSPSSY